MQAQSAYARTARTAKVRAEARAAALGTALEGACRLVARGREERHVSRSFCRWHARCLAAASAAAAKQQRGHHAAIAAATAAAEAEASRAREVAEAAAADAAAMRERLRMRECELVAERASVLALSRELTVADAEAADWYASVRLIEAGASALQAQLATERRARVVLRLRSTLEHKAAESRLLCVLRSQRSALESAALELAAVRRAAALERQAPELEGPWLAPPPPPDETHEETSAEILRDLAEISRAKEVAQRREEAIDGWRRDWLAAMAHSL